MVEEFEKADRVLEIEHISYMDLIAGGYCLGYDVEYFYSEEMLEVAEYKEEETDKNLLEAPYTPPPRMEE